MLLSVTMREDFRCEEGRRQFGTLAGCLALSLLALAAVFPAKAQAPGDAAVTILERMNLGESMVKPGGLYFGRHRRRSTRMSKVHGHQPIHFRGDLLRR